MFGRDTIFVAGDRVQTDAIAVPFSMGRDLLCIYSKKHIENPPELKGEKSKHNRNVMKQMQNQKTSQHETNSHAHHSIWPHGGVLRLHVYVQMHFEIESRLKMGTESMY